MKIRTRQKESFEIGEGIYTLRTSFEQLQLIGSFLELTRLGKGVYKNAAYKLLVALEESFGSDFTHESLIDVGLEVSHIDANDTIIETLSPDEVTFEVT